MHGDQQDDAQQRQLGRGGRCRRQSGGSTLGSAVGSGVHGPRTRDLRPLGSDPTIVEARRMAWFFRAIEQVDGRWACSHGRVVIDQHDELSEALDHLRDVAATMSPAELFVHRLGGGEENIGSV